jgi:two-component system response regulator QseB/two-component system response regulator TctD
MRLLLVEDSPRLGPLLIESLRAAGYLVDLATTAQDFLHLAGINCYALYIIDLGLPDDDGIGLITRLRQKHDHRPILVITARVALEDRISGLDLGADDYLAKPFNKDELLARIRALLRRPPVIAPTLKQVGKLSFELQNQTIQCDGRELNLSPSEHRLLALFLRRTERVVTPGDIEQISNDLGREVSENAVQQAISRLRKLLARIDPALSIRTIRGSGYMLTLGQP